MPIIDRYVSFKQLFQHAIQPNSRPNKSFLQYNEYAVCFYGLICEVYILLLLLWDGFEYLCFLNGVVLTVAIAYICCVKYSFLVQLIVFLYTEYTVIFVFFIYFFYLSLVQFFLGIRPPGERYIIVVNLILFKEITLTVKTLKRIINLNSGLHPLVIWMGYRYYMIWEVRKSSKTILQKYIWGYLRTTVYTIIQVYTTSKNTIPFYFIFFNRKLYPNAKT